jgi:putative membrane protein
LELAPPTFPSISDGHDGHAAHDHHYATPHRHLGPGQWLLRACLFIAMGGYFLQLWLGGTLGYYINARFVWLSVVAAVIFFVLGGSSLHAFFRARFGGYELAYGFHELAGHLHPRITVPLLLVLIAPLVFGLLVPSRPLGANAVGGDLMPNAPTDKSLASSNSQEWTVVDWLRVFYYSGNPDRLNGREADVIGFVYRREGDPKGHFMVARFLMSCCSADASAVGVPVAWNQADNLSVDTWVRVRGPVKVQPFGRNTLPVIDATSVDATIGAPAQPYLYP